MPFFFDKLVIGGIRQNDSSASKTHHDPVMTIYTVPGKTGKAQSQKLHVNLKSCS